MLQPRIYSDKDSVQSRVLLNRRGLWSNNIHDTTKHLDKTKHMKHKTWVRWTSQWITWTYKNFSKFKYLRTNSMVHKTFILRGNILTFHVTMKTSLPWIFFLGGRGGHHTLLYSTSMNAYLILQYTLKVQSDFLPVSLPLMFPIIKNQNWQVNLKSYNVCHVQYPLFKVDPTGCGTMMYRHWIKPNHQTNELPHHTSRL